MSGGWNAKPNERQAAERLWAAGVPRKRIAVLLGVSHHTVTNWRWRDGWRPRSDYASRPIVEPKQPRLGPRRPALVRCGVCCGRMDPADPHVHGRAA